jgi:hypothetical protein
MRICADNPEVFRGAVLRNWLLENNAILRFFAVCQDIYKTALWTLPGNLGEVFLQFRVTLKRRPILRFFAVV